MKNQIKLSSLSKETQAAIKKEIAGMKEENLFLKKLYPYSGSSRKAAGYKCTVLSLPYESLPWNPYPAIYRDRHWDEKPIVELFYNKALPIVNKKIKKLFGIELLRPKKGYEVTTYRDRGTIDRHLTVIVPYSTLTVEQINALPEYNIKEALRKAFEPFLQSPLGEAEVDILKWLNY